MRKEIKNSLDELFEEVNLFEKGRVKPKRTSKFMPLLATIVVSAAVLLFSITQISQQNQTANLQEIPIEVTSIEETQIIVSENTLGEELKTAVKQPGIPNMVEPDAQITFMERLISIWFQEDGSAVIIYNDEPNAYYIVPHAPVLKEYVKSF